MLAIQKKRERKEPTCYSDHVFDVPKTIINERHGVAYTRLHFIGSGSYGKCYEIVKNTSKERFACKIVSRVMLEDDDMKRLLQSEISIHRKLNHQHVTTFIQSFEDDRFIYMVQGLCANQSLRDLQRMRGNHLLTPEECRYFASQIMKGAQYIHSQRVIHRDLKLSNILVDINMQSKICDFGLAIRTDDPRLQIPTLCGTTNYLAPEVVTKRGFTCETDVWAIGVVIFVLSFGYKPFEEHDAYTTHQRIIRADYKVPSEASAELKDMLRRIFERDVYNRATAAECLKMDFFRKHNIPNALPTRACTEKTSFSDIAEHQPSFALEESLYSPEAKMVEYPRINVIAEQKLESSFENHKYAHVLEQTFQRFDAICRFQEGDEEFSIDDITGTNDCKPPFWVTNWLYDRNIGHESWKGFIYQASDGSRGMLFNNSNRLMKSPDKRFWKLEYGDEEFTLIRNEFDEAKMDSELKIYHEYEAMLIAKGTTTPLVSFSERNSIYLYTWLQTNDAMVMVLSNNTIQLNFTKSHMKFLIHPKKETISFVHNQISADNIKTVNFDTLAKFTFSKHTFVLFKYITAVLQHMAKILQEA